MPIDLSSLNENQLKAVLWEEGPLLVLAGPGSGKTRVLTLRIARLLEQCEDTAILALTFTEKASAEMRARVDDLLRRRGDRARICTFHSFAIDLLRQHGTHIGLRPDFQLMTQEEDRLHLLNAVTESLRQEGHEIEFANRDILGFIDWLFAESYDGDGPIPRLAKRHDWWPLLFNSYCTTLIEENRLDFGSLLNLSQRLLRTKPAVARLARLGWTHVCVDEFQDTNRAQYNLLSLIIPNKKPNLFVVGDEDQIVYQWNGASPERLAQLRQDYEMNLVQLPENYRCPREIVDLANLLIARNRFRTTNKKPLAAQKEARLDNGVLHYEVFADQDAEVAFLAVDIRSRKLFPADCVVLARNTKLLEAAARALVEAGLEAHLSRRKHEFDSPVIKVLFEALRLANARHDREVLRRLCVAWEALSDKTLEVEDIAAGASLVGGDFLRSWISAARQQSSGPATDLAERIGASLVERLEFPEIVEWFLDQGNSPWRSGEDRELEEELARWNEIHQEIVRERGRDNLTLDLYLQQAALAPKATPPTPRAIRCMTVHGSKGMEFRHVYLMGLAQEILPSFQAIRKGLKSRHLEEERRNCFVAITRAQESLTLTRARRYNGYRKEPSQFLAEMGLEPDQL